MYEVIPAASSQPRAEQFGQEALPRRRWSVKRRIAASAAAVALTAGTLAAGITIGRTFPLPAQDAAAVTQSTENSQNSGQDAGAWPGLEDESLEGLDGTEPTTDEAWSGEPLQGIPEQGMPGEMLPEQTAPEQGIPEQGMPTMPEGATGEDSTDNPYGQTVPADGAPTTVQAAYRTAGSESTAAAVVDESAGANVPDYEDLLAYLAAEHEHDPAPTYLVADNGNVAVVNRRLDDVRPSPQLV